MSIFLSPTSVLGDIDGARARLAAELQTKPSARTRFKLQLGAFAELKHGESCVGLELKMCSCLVSVDVG
jgi:hypothetical protein